MATLWEVTTAHLLGKSLALPKFAAADTLRVPAFRYLWGGYSLTHLANQMRMMIIAWLVLDLTNSQLWVGLVNGLPAVAIAAFALTWFPEDTNRQQGQTVSLWRQLGEGFRYAGATQHVWWLLLLGGIAIFPASFFPLMPGHARDTLNGGPEVLGFLIGGFGFGGLLGSVLLASRRDVSRKGLAMVIAALVWSLALTVLAFSSSFYVSLGCLFMIGLMWSVWMNSLNTLLQTTVPQTMQGRIISINKIVSQGGMAWLIGGLLGAALGLTATFLLAGILFVTLHLLAYWRTPELRQVD